MPKLSPGTFHEMLKGSKVDLSRKEVKVTVYTIKILKVLKQVFRLTSDDFDAINNRNVKFPMESIKGRLNNLTFNTLHIDQLKGVTIGSLFRVDDTSPVLTRAKELPMDEGFGLIFPVESYGDWIIHNLGAEEDHGTGSARIVIQSRITELPNVWIEPLRQFLANLPKQ